MRTQDIPKRGRIPALAAMFVALAMLAVVPAAADHTNENLPTTTLLEQPQAVAGNDAESCDNGNDYFFRLNGDADGGTDADLESGTWDMPGGAKLKLTVPSTKPPAEGGHGTDKTLDFEIVGGSAGEIRIKGGSFGHNVYDYLTQNDNGASDELANGTVSADTYLHSPVQSKGRGYQFGGLSHISVCYDVATEIEIVKTPDGGEIGVGDVLSFDIVVSDVADGIDALNVTITDDLPGDRDWTTGDDRCSITADDADGYLDDLLCSLGDLADGTSATGVTVSSAAPATEGDCDVTFNNVAFADADNADEVNNPGDITVLCTDLSIEKSPDSDTITIGEYASFDIAVSDVADGIDALNVTVTDDLPGDRDWTTGDDRCSITADDADGYLDDLSCSLGDLADGTTAASITVSTAATVTAGDCDYTFENVAYADADNADEVSNPGDITVLCGGLQVVKTAKHADDSGQTSANLAATFQVTDASGDTHTVVTDATTGLGCVDDLPLGEASVVELEGPDGYAKDTDTEKVTVTNADCGDTDVAEASFENVPLTDISWTVDAQHDGGTHTRVVCVDSDGNVYDTLLDGTGDGTDTIEDLLPTWDGESALADGNRTLRCDFYVDP